MALTNLFLDEPASVKESESFILMWAFVTVFNTHVNNTCIVFYIESFYFINKFTSPNLKISGLTL